MTGFLQSMCRKTRLCKYYAHGRCTRRQNCVFAHSLDELRSPPDLSCTKVCPVLVRDGTCEDPNCTFAHQKGDLRKVRLSGAARMADAARMQGARDAAAGRRGKCMAAESAEAKSGEVWRTPGLSDIALPAPGGPQPFSRQTSVEEGFNRQYSSSSGVNEAITDSGGPTSSEASLFLAKEVGCTRRRRAGGKANVEPGRKPAPGFDWGQKFHKTALCAFDRQGKCNKGAACHFAHGEEELRPLPDLYCTKLCMRFVNTGSCQDPNCRYAHTRDQLRTGSASNSSQGSEEPVAPEPKVVRKQRTWPMDQAVPTAMSSSDSLCVKNTFLTFEELPPLDLPPKARTQPNLTGHGGEEDEDGAKPDLPSADSEDEEDREGSSAPEEPEPEVGFDVPEVLVKNTFLTIEEPTDLCLPNKSKSSPDVSKRLVAARLEDEEDALASAYLPNGLVAEVATRVSHQQETTVVPVCAIQQVDHLLEKPVMFADAAFALPAQKKVRVKAGQMQEGRRP